MNYPILEKNFGSHGFITHCFETGAQAAAYLKEQIQGTTVALGGSITSKELELDKVLSEKNTVYWHWNIPGRETLMSAREADVYICSANGVSETGELVNIDGTGNRIAMTAFGPKKTYFLIGKNKLAPDLASAIDRAQNVAAPKNAARLGLDTPCVRGGKCFHCNHSSRICKATLILERPVNGMDVEILFIDQELGY